MDSAQAVWDTLGSALGLLVDPRWVVWVSIAGIVALYVLGLEYWASATVAIVLAPAAGLRAIELASMGASFSSRVLPYSIAACLWLLAAIFFFLRDRPRRRARTEALAAARRRAAADAARPHPMD